jgi:hypothetical protein
MMWNIIKLNNLLEREITCVTSEFTCGWTTQVTQIVGIESS